MNKASKWILIHDPNMIGSHAQSDKSQGSNGIHNYFSGVSGESENIICRGKNQNQRNQNKKQNSVIKESEESSGSSEEENEHAIPRYLSNMDGFKRQSNHQ